MLVAGVACCVAMSMPQVQHRRLLRRPATGRRGAEMLSLMLACGIAGAGLSGRDLRPHRRPRARCCLGRRWQGIALLFSPFDRWSRLRDRSSPVPGLFQAGIVLSHAIIVREHFRPSEGAAPGRHGDHGQRWSAWRLGGWMSPAGVRPHRLAHAVERSVRDQLARVSRRMERAQLRDRMFWLPGANFKCRPPDLCRQARRPNESPASPAHDQGLH